MIRILNAEPDNYSPEARQILTSIGELVERRLSQAELIQWVPDFNILIVRLGLTVSREVIEAGRRLRAILTATTGLDHIDVELAQDKGIAVLSLRGEVEFLCTVSATAEHTWGLLMALVRHIPRAAESVRDGDWNREAFRGHDLCGKRLGILGLGRIGEKVARYGLEFGMQVYAFDPYRNDWPVSIVHCPSLDDLLQRSDVLSLHVPLNPETFLMIGKRELALVPQGAVLINTARGAILDEAALVDALVRGHFAGAALDVIEDELNAEKRQNSLLLAYAREHDNVLITPHIGGATVESMARTEVFLARKLQHWSERERLIIDKERNSHE